MSLFLSFLLLLSFLFAQTGSTGIPPNEAKTLDTYVPGDITLVDSEGREFKLSDLKGKPIILSPIYTTCKASCPLITRSLKKVIPEVGTPGKDFWVISFTFNPKDTLENLKEFKKEYQINTPGWIVAMAKTKDDLFRLLDAIDFRFMTVGEDFIHPNVLVILSPELQIKKYFYGVTYDKYELINALRYARGEIALPDKFRSYLFIIGLFGVVATSVYILYTLNKILQRRKKYA
ncbi:SCO family protein [Aquifex sp.]